MSIAMDSSINTNSTLSLVLSNKRPCLLIMNQHVDGYNKKTAREKYGKCIISGCTIHVHTNDNDIYFCGSKDYHDRESTLDLNYTTCLRQQMKQCVVNELTPIAIIYEEEIAKASLDTSIIARFSTNQEICE